MTDTDMPRIAHVAAELPARLRIDWKGGGSDIVDLAGWIAAGRCVLAGLADPDVFAAPRLIAFDSAVEWGEPDGPPAIDAHHLKLIADEQKAFGAPELVDWQRRTGVSNREAAGFLGVAVSTYARWKSEGGMPTIVGMVCRASLRDPIMISAYLRPRRGPGRPRRVAA